MSLFVLYYPIGSMYGIFTYIWLIFMVNVAKYTIHGYYGYINPQQVYPPGNKHIPKNGILKMIFLFFEVGDVSSLEGISISVGYYIHPQGGSNWVD